MASAEMAEESRAQKMIILIFIPMHMWNGHSLHVIKLKYVKFWILSLQLIHSTPSGENLEIDRDFQT